jgi:pimeloyl-ACP methyl ester carboxylesterase
MRHALFLIASLSTMTLLTAEAPHPTPYPATTLPVAKPQKYSITTTHGDIAIWDTGGNGKPVLFVHGNSSFKEIFTRQFESDLSKKYRFVAFDLPGHGDSQKAKDPEKTYNADGYADVVSQIIEKLQLKNPVAVGWSLGGQIVLNALSKSQKFSGVLITGTPPIEVSFEGFGKGFLPAPKVMELFSKVEFSKQNAIDFLTGVGCNIDLEKYPSIIESVLKTDGYARKYLSASIAKKIGGDQKALVETNDTPLCVVLGKNEIVNVKYVTEDIRYKNLFHNKVYLIDNTSHFAHWEKPEQFNQILAEFLSETLKD